MIITQSSNVKTQNDNLKLKSDLRQRSYKFSLDIIKATSVMVRSLSNDIIAKQLIRSATSIGANIIEAKSSSSRRDFVNFYSHALKSANETKYWLELTKDTNDLVKDRITILLIEAEEISKMLAASIITLKKKNKF